MSASVSSRLAAVERHPEWDRLRQQRPSTGRYQAAVVVGVLFGLFFTGVALFMIGGILATDLAPAWPALFIAPVVLIGPAIIIWLVGRWRRFTRAPLAVAPALVIDKRLHVWGGGSNSSSHTNYHVTLEFKDGARRELEATGKIYGLVRQDDLGVAWIKEQYLLDFHALSPVEPAHGAYADSRTEHAAPPRPAPLPRTPPSQRQRTVVQSGHHLGQPDEARGSELSLDALQGPLKGQRIPIDKGQFQVGAGTDSDLRIAADDYLSDNHAVFQASGSQWLLFDQDSTNGTFVDGEKVTSGRGHTLRHGHSIRMGASEFRVVLGSDIPEPRDTELR